MSWPEITTELLAMAREDARVRSELAVDGSLGPELPPPDWAARQREMDAWCREVGWRV
jgi:hypothetical protein